MKNHNPHIRFKVRSTKVVRRALTIVIVALLWVTAFAKDLGPKDARREIAEVLGIDKADKVHIKNINTGMGGEAIVEAQFEAVFRFAQDKDGKWKAAEVRTGDRNWESIELIQTAVRKEKILRTTAELNMLATALEAFRRERGFYVQADTGAALVDNLAPRYLKTIIRLDAWSQEFDYKGAANSYRLSSRGPDEKADTADDIVIENGEMVKGAAR